MCGSNQGWEIRAPVAVGVIGGVVTSTLLTLVLVPAVYLLLDALAATRSGRRSGHIVSLRQTGASREQIR